MIDWSNQKSFFEWDGSWRDLYIFNTDRSDWNILLSAVRSQQLEATFKVEGKSHPLPETIDAIFLLQEQSSVFLHIRSDNLNINCHFFDIKQIEFDIDPREVINAKTFKQVVNFMRFIGNLVGKMVCLTPENAPMYCQLYYNPVDDTITPRSS